MNDVRLTNKDADAIRYELATAKNTVWWFEMAAMFVMPVFLGLLGNALVSQIYAPSPDRLVISITIALLVVCVGLQLLFGIIALRRPSSHSTIDAAAHRTEVEGLQAALRRKTDVHNTLRASFDEFNVQVCNVNGWCENEFQLLLDHVFAPTRAVIDRVLGIHDRVYTIELYLDDTQLPESTIDWSLLEESILEHLPLVGTSLSLRYFYASERITDEAPIMLADHHPANLAWSTHVPDEYPLEKYRQLYGDDQSPNSDVYFRRVITVPVRMVCSPDSYWGVLVITTMQSEPVADDAIDNLQWLSTLTTNFIAAYNKCKESQIEKLKASQEEQKKQIRREQRAARAASTESEHAEDTP